MGPSDDSAALLFHALNHSNVVKTLGYSGKCERVFQLTRSPSNEAESPTVSTLNVGMWSGCTRDTEDSRYVPGEGDFTIRREHNDPTSRVGYEFD
jgi:hypothetical protein